MDYILIAMISFLSAICIVLSLKGGGNEDYYEHKCLLQNWWYRNNKRCEENRNNRGGYSITHRKAYKQKGNKTDRDNRKI